MKLSEQSILFFTRTMQLGGTENVILQMCEILKPVTKKIVVCSCGGLNVNKLEKMGIKHYEIPDIDSKSPIVLLKVFKIVHRIIKKEKISIVHTHHRMATFYMFFLKKICNVKIISTLHGCFSDKKFLTHLIYKKIDIIACGENVKITFSKNYNIDNNVTVINNAIKKEKNEDVNIGLDDYNKSHKKVAFIGRLSEEKGVSDLLEAMHIILKNEKSISLIIVGEGPQEEELKKKVKELKIEKNVVFLGYQDRIQSIINQIDLVVLPSYTEGLPLTPIEAFLCGKPVVATFTEGSAEIIDDNINGFLVPIGNIEILANKIQMILQDKSLYNKMCVEAKKSYNQRYTFNVFKNKILSYYKMIVEVKNEKK